MLIDYSFLFDEEEKTGHCYGKKTPVLTAVDGQTCEVPGCYAHSAGNHHGCAQRKSGEFCLFCVCESNRDIGENGQRVLHYFKRSDMAASDFICLNCWEYCYGYS